MGTADTHRIIEAVWRIESPRLIAGLTRIVRDVALAEELAQDALVIALEKWPSAGVPTNPGGWLMSTAKHRAIDQLRRQSTLERKQELIGRQLEIEQSLEPDLVAVLDDTIGDDLLRLMFISCHPVLSPEARAALTLRLLGGLTTAEIARGFLTPESTIAQRIVRAKRTLSDAAIPFEVPPPHEFTERLDSVLEVIYLIFNEGYLATSGEHLFRTELCEEALRLGRVLLGLVPEQPEAHGLVALMEIQASRLRARVGPKGEPVLLHDQDRTRWDRLLIQRGLAGLERARQLGGEAGFYTLQAAIAACHVRTITPKETDWKEIVSLYDTLATVAPSPVIELSRAVALSMASGPQAGLDAVDRLAASGSLDGYHLLFSVRGDLLSKLGRHDEARLEFERAATLTNNAREKDLLRERARDTAG